MVPCAHLRAYEPLDVFPPLDRQRWGEYVAGGAGMSLTEASAAEQRLAAARLLTGRGPLQREAALVRRVGGRTHLCPLQFELRAAAALRGLRATLPHEVMRAFVPDPAALAALDEAASVGRRPHIQDHPWTVPLAWFVAFAPDERHFVDPAEGRGPRLTYLTTGAQASARLVRAIGVVEETLEDGEDLLAELADVLDWVESFDREALVELDYGRVAGMFPVAELAQDETCERLWDAIDALGDGDVMAAAAYYGVARSRWTTLRHRQSVN